CPFFLSIETLLPQTLYTTPWTSDDALAWVLRRPILPKGFARVVLNRGAVGKHQSTSAASLVAGPLGQVLAVGVSSRRKRNPGTGELLREFSVLNGRPRQRKADVIHGVRYVDAVHGTVATAVGCARYL